MNFYVINVHRFCDKIYAFGEPVGQETGDYDKCDICGAPVSMRKWLPPLKVKLSKPSYGDFVFGSFVTFLVTERFRKGYEASKLNGIVSFEAVEVTKVNRKRESSPEPPDYYYVSIVRSKAAIDEEKSKVIRDEPITCNHCRAGGIIKSQKGVFFEENTWSGEDIFYSRGGAGIVVLSERFVDFVREYGFTNISFTTAGKYIPSWVL